MSGNESHQAARQRAPNNGRWGAGEGKGNCKADSVTCKCRTGAGAGWATAVPCKGGQSTIPA